MRIPTFVAFAFVASSTSCVGFGIESSHSEPPAGSYSAATMRVEASGADDSVSAARVSERFFEEARVTPLLGRFFTSAEYRPGATAVAVLAHAYWRSRFNGAPDIIGKQIQIDGRPTVIIGVAPPGFDFPRIAHLWVPRTTQ